MSISLVPKVRIEESQTTSAQAAAQPQANITTSQLSLSPGDAFAPVADRARRDTAVRRFVTNNGLECRGDIYEMMEQEAGRMVGWGLFSSKDEAENAIWDAYEDFVQKADPQAVSKAIDDLSNPRRTHKLADARVKEMQAESERMLNELESAEQALTPLRMVWLECHAKLKPFGLDGSIPGWEKRAENLLKQTRDPHKRRRLRPLLQKELDARQAYYTASKRRDALSKLADTCNCDPAYVRDLVIEECDTFADFLRECRQPGTIRKRIAFVHHQVASKQKQYIEFTSQINQIVTECWLTGSKPEDRPEKNWLDILRDRITDTLGRKPLVDPDVSQIEAEARTWEKFCDLGNPEQVLARVEEENEKLNNLYFDEAAIFLKLDSTKEGLEAIDSEYQRILTEVIKTLPGIDAMIPLMVEKEETFHYEGPHEQEVKVLIALYKLRARAQEKIQELQNQHTALRSKIIEQKMRLGIESEST